MAEVDVHTAISTGTRAPDALPAAKEAREIVGHRVALDERGQRGSVDCRRRQVAARGERLLDACDKCALVLRIEVRIGRQFAGGGSTRTEAGAQKRADLNFRSCGQAR